MIRRVGAIYRLRAHDLDDFVQDAWLTVLSGLSQGRYDPCRGRLADWLYIVARNRAVSYFRQRWRAENGRAELPLERLESPVSQDPSRLLERRCDVETVRHALEILRQRVSPTAFAVFHRRQIKQCSVEEVAKTMAADAPAGTRLRSSARRKLGSILLRHGWA